MPLIDDLSDPADYSAARAAAEGYLGTVGPRAAMKGYSEASGLPSWLGGFRAPAGMYRMWRGDPGAQDAFDRARIAAIAAQDAAQRQHPNAYTAGQVPGYAMSALPGYRAAFALGQGGKFLAPRFENSQPSVPYDSYGPDMPAAPIEDRRNEPLYRAVPAMAGSVANAFWQKYFGTQPPQAYAQAPANSLEAQGGYNQIGTNSAGQRLGDILNANPDY
jgi:hypothetical protein